MTNTNVNRVRIEPGSTKHSIRVIDLPLANCRVNPNQPRQQFDETALAELASSIEKHGLLQPITVTRDKKNKEGFMVVAGERRFRAFGLLGRDVIPAILTSGNIDEIALIENLQREDLNALEEAEALANLKKKYGYTHIELGQAIGKAQSTISEILKITTLPLKIRKDLRTSDVNKSILIELARIKDKKEQLKYWQDIKERGATVKQARAKKHGQVVKPSVEASQRTLTTAKRMITELERIAGDTSNTVFSSEQYEELLSVYERFVSFVDQEAERHVKQKD